MNFWRGGGIVQKDSTGEGKEFGCYSFWGTDWGEVAPG